MAEFWDDCEECGFTYDLDRSSSAAADVVALAGQIADVVGGDECDVHQRPERSVWSILEYGCHVRDVLLVQRERVLDARRTDLPSFRPMGREERADHDGYAEQDPTVVARELRDAAAMFANVLDRLGRDWDRTLVYNYPVRAERSLRWVAVHTVHECRHHLQDVERQRTRAEDR